MGVMTTTPAVRDPRRRGWGYRLTAVVSGVLVFAAAGCSNTTNPPTVADCNKVDFPLIDIPPRTTGEPTMKIPQPPGWEVVPVDVGTLPPPPPGLEGFDSADILEITLVNRALGTTADFMMLPVEAELPGEELPSAAQAFDVQQAALISRGLDIQSVVPATVCGQQAEISEYTQAAKGGNLPVSAKILVVLAESENVTYLATLNVLTNEPDNPTYQRDSQAMLDGLVFLPPDPR